MAFQKCPVCDGTGKSTTEFGGDCHVCQGYGIINSDTGLPPIKTVTSNHSFDPNFNFGNLLDNMHPYPKCSKNLKCDEYDSKCVPPTQTEE